MHIVVGLYPDGSPGELFAYDRKMGGTEHAFLEALLTSASIGLQNGVPLGEFVGKWRGMIFKPSGFTGDSEFRQASSILDLLAQWLQKRFSN